MIEFFLICRVQILSADGVRGVNVPLNVSLRRPKKKYNQVAVENCSNTFLSQEEKTTTNDCENVI